MTVTKSWSAAPGFNGRRQYDPSRWMNRGRAVGGFGTSKPVKGRTDRLPTELVKELLK